jgi:osmotically-inducible protein OsmY
MPRRYEDDRYRGDDRWDRGERDRAQDRGYFERARDEVRSWFGDDDAERRRRVDEQRARERECEWRRRHGMEPSRDWERGREWDRDRDWAERTRWYTSPERERAYGGERPREEWWSERERDWEHPYSSARPWGEWDDRETRQPATFGYRYAGSTATWERYRGRGPKGYQRSDTRIYEDVCDRLSLGDVDAENIEVQVSKAEVTLSGWVRNRWDKRIAEDVAESVPGVKDVHNNIRVRGEGGLGMSETSSSDRPGSTLEIEETGSGTTATGPASTPGTRRS